MRRKRRSSVCVDFIFTSDQDISILLNCRRRSNRHPGRQRQLLLQPIHLRILARPHVKISKPTPCTLPLPESMFYRGHCLDIMLGLAERITSTNSLRSLSSAKYNTKGSELSRASSAARPISERTKSTKSSISTCADDCASCMN